MNKDVELLKRCYGLEKEIAMLNKKILADRVALYGAVVKYSDLPKAQGDPNMLGNRYAELLDKEDARLATIAEHKEALSKAEGVLRKVADSHRRMFFRFIYMEGLPVWRGAQLSYISQRTGERIKSEVEKADCLW